MSANRTDNVLSRARAIRPTSDLTKIRERVGGSDRNDYYRFRLYGRSRFNLTLSGLSANADVALLDRAGRLVQRSERGGARNETLRRPLKAGVYYLRVYSKGRSTSYQLNFRATNINRFNIRFDYRFDTRGWFTSKRRKVLEAAARLWEDIILDDFPRVPVNVRTPNVLNPQTGQIIETFVTNYAIDDLVVFVGARDLPGSTLALAYETGWYRNQRRSRRYTGPNFEPWIGSIMFNSTVNWFYDSTPRTSRVRKNHYDFVSVAAHELGHVLGVFGRINAFRKRISDGFFIGPQARSRNGGRAVPLNFTDISHISDGYQPRGSGRALMAPLFYLRERRLPTVLDAAILDDIGYRINYNATFRNRPFRLTALQTGSRTTSRGVATSGPYGLCGCTGCLMSDSSAFSSDLSASPSLHRQTAAQRRTSGLFATI